MSFKLKGSYETAIYPTEDGYVAIKQPDPMGGDDSVVLLAAHQLEAVIAHLQELLEDRASWEFETEPEKEPD